MISGKIWGQTQDLLVTPLVEIHHIKVDPNATCSMHKHEFKWNLFYVIKGQLMIEVRKNDYDLVDKTILGPNEWTSVRPNEFHRFVSLNEPVEALEVYYLEPITKDIVRENVGGLVDKITDEKQKDLGYEADYNPTFRFHT